MAATKQAHDNHATPVWLLVFCYALLGPAMGINAVFVALAIPAMAQFGVSGLVAAGAFGALLGIVPTIWMSRQIAKGIREDL
jgi:hypothetical protein